MTNFSDPVSIHSTLLGDTEQPSARALGAPRSRSNDVALEVTGRFARKLRLALRQRYGRCPTAKFLADQFNLKARYCPPISSETARRWMNGLSMPELHRFAVLLDLLNVPADTLLPRDSDVTGSSALPPQGSPSGTLRRERGRVLVTCQRPGSPLQVRNSVKS